MANNVNVERTAADICTIAVPLPSWLNANDPSSPGYRNAVLTHRLLTDIRKNDTPERRAYVAERLDHF